MNQKTKPRWQALRTAESRMVEKMLRKEFPHTDAYRFNCASIRVRVIDPRFKGKSTPKRALMVEPLIEQLPAETQQEIINLLAFYPGETEKSIAVSAENDEFEDPRTED